MKALGHVSALDFDGPSDKGSRCSPKVDEGVLRMNDIPLVDLRRQHAAIQAEVMAAVARVIESQTFILGPEVKTFESDVALRLGVDSAIGVASGSDALFLALVSAGVCPGHEVITSPFSFIATAEAIARIGATPIFADIDAATFNLDPHQALTRITSKTQAILPVHLFGQCARMEPLIDVAQKGTFKVIEDAAQAFGARRGGKEAGSLGDLGCFSFFPSKNLGAWGDGGMVVTRHGALGERILRLRAHGGAKHYVSEEMGLNSRLDALQAAVLRVKLRHIEAWTGARRDVAAYYRTLFASSGLDEHIGLPIEEDGAFHVYNQFTIRAQQREDLRAFLTSQGIGSAVYYPLPLHLQPCFSHLGHKIGDFPQAEQASREVLSLPMHPFLSRFEQERVVDAIRSFYRGAP